MFRCLTNPHRTPTQYVGIYKIASRKIEICASYQDYKYETWAIKNPFICQKLLSHVDDALSQKKNRIEEGLHGAQSIHVSVKKLEPKGL